MFNNFRKMLTPLLIILLLFSIVVIGAPTYVNVGPTTDFEGDVGIPDGSGYYINDILFSTLGLIDISTLAKTDGGIIVGDGTNFVLEIGATARASLGLAIGSDIQAYDAGLLNLAGLTYASDSFIKATGEDTYAIRTITETKTDLSLDNVENLKVKLDATAAPGVGNDNTEGYAVGSRWIDVTNDKEYVALDVSTGAAVWTETTGAAGGYTNLTSFVDQTAWRLFYSNADGDVTELAFGTSGQYLKSTGATSSPIFDTPSGAGDMLKATYDTDADGDIDVAAGGTEKSIWTLYAIPYLSGTTVFGEIPIGTAGQVLKVGAGATSYEFADESDPTVDSDAEIKAILVDEVTKTGSFTAGRIAKINNATGIIEQGTNTDTDVADAVTKKHTQNTDTDLDPTFEATFVKKADNVNVLADITSTGANIEDAVTKRHIAGADTTLGTMTADVNMGTHKLTGLSVPSASGQSVRTTATITEASLEDAVSKKHSQNTDTQFDFYNALTSDHDWSGDKDSQPVGESVVFGDLLYFNWTDKEWKKTDADVAATMPGLRIALESKSDGQTCLMLVKGYIRDDSAFEFTASMVYASVTPGAMSSTAPTETGDQIQRVGQAKSADILFFDPSIDVGEI